MTSAPERARLLLVEDEPLVSRNMEAILEDAGHEVVGVLSAAEDVTEAVRALAPDLVLLDIGLGGVRDGIDLATELDVPVLFVSGRADDQTLARARGLGAFGFVVKPFSARQLVAAVQVALAKGRGSRRQRRAAQALESILEVLDNAGMLRDEGAQEVSSPRIRALPALANLSAREREVLDQILAYRRPPQIAKQLHISPHTVRNHLKSIYAKLGVRSQAELLDLLLDRE